MSDHTDDVDAEEPTPPVILLACDRPNCGYVVYDAGDGNDNTAEAQRLYEGHIFQHDHPEEWLAQQAAAAEEAEG